MYYVVLPHSFPSILSMEGWLFWGKRPVNSHIICIVRMALRMILNSPKNYTTWVVIKY